MAAGGSEPTKSMSADCATHNTCKQQFQSTSWSLQRKHAMSQQMACSDCLQAFPLLDVPQADFVAAC